MPSTSARPRLSVLAELALVLAILVGTKLVFDQIAWRYAGPISLLFTLATILVVTLRRRESWSSFGLVRLRRWWSVPMLLPQALLGVVAILGIGVGIGLLGEALGFWSLAETEAGVEARWGDIEGNLPVYLGWLALSWISAGFGEEVFFRGYMIDRIGKLLPKARWATAIAVIVPAIGFGLAHAYYQGVRGLVVTGLIGLALGTLYLLNKRNLWPLILAHGVVDTLAFTAMYLDLDI